MGNPEMNERMVKRTAMRRPGEPQEIANAIAFLCSDLASTSRASGSVVRRHRPLHVLTRAYCGRDRATRSRASTSRVERLGGRALAPGQRRAVPRRRSCPPATRSSPGFASAASGATARRRTHAGEDVELPRRESSPLAVSAADGRVYAGCEPSALFVSDDGGDSWRELATLLDLPSQPDVELSAQAVDVARALDRPEPARRGAAARRDRAAAA